jgi:DNA (cytosine-5)-methyltransferase 1
LSILKNIQSREDLISKHLKIIQATSRSEPSELDENALRRVQHRMSTLSDDFMLENKNAMLILANTLCLPSNPDCSNCPIVKLCSNGRLVHDKNSSKNGDEIPFLDAFCGAGGLSLGFENMGFKPVMAIDHDDASMQTYIYNRPGLSEDNVITSDISTYVKSSTIPKAPLVIGGPPCQGFSNANQQPLSEDPRNLQYKNFLSLVSQSCAEFFIMENVVGIMQAKEAISWEFRKLGYITEPFILNTNTFGFPQNRKRVFFLGVKTDSDQRYLRVKNALIDTINSFMGKYEFSLFDAIGDLPKLEAKTKRNSTNLENSKWGYTVGPGINPISDFAKIINDGKYSGPLYNHRTKYNNARDIQIYGTLNPGEGSNADSIKEIMPYKSRVDIFKDKFYKLDYSKPSKTITAHMYYDCHMYIHPDQARGLTPREAARIQGFADEFLFLGYPNEWYRQIGNAVSPLIARILAAGVKSIFESGV